MTTMMIIMWMVVYFSLPQGKNSSDATAVTAIN